MISGSWFLSDDPVHDYMTDLNKAVGYVSATQIALYVLLAIINIFIIIFAPDHILTTLGLTVLVICISGGISITHGNKDDCNCDCDIKK